MEVQFTPEQIPNFLRIEDEKRFREAVRKGIEQADNGLFVDKAEIEVLISRLLSR